MGQLSGQRRKKIQAALLEGFLKSDLEQMVSFHLNESLYAIAGGENFSEVVFQLIQWAERTGRVGELIEGAYKSNPTNPLIKQLKQDSLTWGIEGMPSGQQTPLVQPPKRDISPNIEPEQPRKTKSSVGFPRAIWTVIIVIGIIVVTTSLWNYFERNNNSLKSTPPAAPADAPTPISSNGIVPTITTGISNSVLSDLPLISNLWVASGKSYRVETCGKGSFYYIDDAYKITNISHEEFDGLPCIKTSNDGNDKENDLINFLKFTLNQSATIYLYFDRRMERPPGWTNDLFTKIDNVEIYVDDPDMDYFQVYECQSAAGEITLGSVKQGEELGSKSMYVVAFREGGDSPNLCSNTVATSITTASIGVSESTSASAATPTPTAQSTPTSTLLPPSTAVPKNTPTATITESTSISQTFSAAIKSQKITRAGEFDSYTFNGNEGDRALISVADTGPNVHFRIDVELFTPGGESILHKSDNTVVYLDQVLPTKGSYKIFVRDDDTTTGEYSLTLENISPGYGQHISYGDVIEDNIEYPGDFDVFTFHGNKGEKIFLTAADKSPNVHFYIDVQLIDPVGNILISTNENSLVQFTEELQWDGMYTILIKDPDNTKGSYTLTIENADSNVIDLSDTSRKSASE